MSEKELDPTDHHLEEARKKGQVAVSEDLLKTACCIMVFEACAMLLRVFGTLWLSYLGDYVGQASRLEDFSPWNANHMVVWVSAATALTLMLGVGAVGLAVVLRWIQTGGPVLVEEPFSFKAEKFNPAEFFKRSFSKKTLTTILGSLAKTAVLVFLAYRAVSAGFAITAHGAGGDLMPLVRLVGDQLTSFVRAAMLALLFISIVDVFIQRKLHRDQLKMSHQDVKEENKTVQGNPEIKQHVRSVGHEMLSKPPSKKPEDPLQAANAVVVNPTHLAIGLRFVATEKRPPVICFKAQEEEATRHIEEALSRGVPVIRHIVLARTLYREPAGATVPRETYALVAAVYRAIQSVADHPADVPSS